MSVPWKQKEDKLKLPFATKGQTFLTEISRSLGKISSWTAYEIKYLTTHFRIPLCKSLAFDGREDRNSLKKDTILPRFFATLEIKQKTNN